jgi:hypothetical protein
VDEMHETGEMPEVEEIHETEMHKMEEMHEIEEIHQTEDEIEDIHGDLSNLTCLRRST